MKFSAGHLKVAAAACCWGLWSLFFRSAERLGPVSPAMEALVAFAVVVLALGPWALSSRPAVSRPVQAWLLLAAFGLCDALTAITFFAAMQRTSVAVAVLTHYLAPVLVAISAPLVFREPLRRGTVPALAVSLAGLLLLLQPWRAGAGDWTGAMLGTASAFFYAANVLFGKGLQRHFTVSEIMAYHMAVSLPILAAFVPAGGFHPTLAILGILVLGGLVGGVLANILFLRGLAVVPAPQASVLTLLEPLVAVTVGAVVWGESPGKLAAVGALLVLVGAYQVARTTPAPITSPDPGSP